VKNSWYVLTGGPGSGKTTILLELEKMGHNVVNEAARVVIDEEMAKGLSIEQIRADEKSFQKKVLDKKLDTEKKLDKDKLTFFDRGMHDTVAYLELINNEVSEELRKLIHKSKYKKVFLLEPLPYQKDYARIEDREQVARLNELLYNAYHKARIPVIKVPENGIEERVKFILDNL
jgi:predicted ATPase